MSIFVLTTTLGLTACGLGRSASNKTTSVPAETRIAAYKLGTADVGYQAALGYPGSLTDFSGTLQSGMTYKFMNFPNGLYVPAGVNNVTFFGCRFASNALSDANVAVYGDNIVFDYDSFVPSKVSAPPATYNQGYQYGIDVRGSVQVTVNHSDFWGWGNGIQFGFSSQAKPFVVKNSYFHDARGDGGIDHTDAILENYGGQSYMVFDNNKIVSAGNTNGLALQNGNKGGYQNVTITNNYFSGFGYTLNLCGYFNGCSNINFSGNTYGTDIKPVWGPLYSWSNGNGNIWRCNKWRVAPGGYSSKTEDDGKYWLSSGNLSATDSGGGSCADSGGVPTPAPTPEPTPTPAPAPAPIPTPAPSATQSILSKQLPSGKKSSDGANVNYELGMKFSANIDGRITAVRFYKSSSESGIHTGRIYSSSGSLLASVQFRNESASGWQVQNLSSPLSIAAHTAYVVSVNTGNSYYVDTVSGFASKIVSGNLSANVGAGVYGPVGSMPSRVYQNSNYFRDVVFVPGASAPSPAPAPIPTPAPTPAPQPGPSPNPAPPAGVKNCALNPSSCGYPDDTNTGIQSGVTLKRIPQDVSSGAGWHYDSRGWISIDTDGAVFNGYSVDTNIDVTANNVTVSNVRSTAGGESFGISLRHTQNVTIRNCEIAPRDMTGPNRLLVAIKDIYGDATGTQILKNNIYHASTGIQVYSGLVQDNYVHDMGFNAGDHVNGLTVNSGTTLMTIQHNTIFNQLSQTDAISLFQDFGVETNKIIDNNLVAGGGYTIYAGSGTKGATSNIRVTNNRISRIYFPNGGDFGPATAYEPGGSGNVWSGNVWDDTNAAVSQP